MQGKSYGNKLCGKLTCLQWSSVPYLLVAKQG